MAAVATLGLIILGVCIVIGIFLSFFGLPGPLVIFAGALVYAFLTWFDTLSIVALSVIFALAIAAEVLEWIVHLFGATAFGTSKWGVAGTVIGGILGVVLGYPLFLVGPVVGLFVGAFIVGFLFELMSKKRPWKAFKGAFGALVGRAGSILIKLVITVIILGFIYSKIYA